jgi:cytoskeleton protein RodZ
VNERPNSPDRSGSQRVVISSVEELVSVRERRGMTQSEVAQRLKLYPRQLAALERGDWAALPGRAFVRGCVRVYGRLLNADVEPLLTAIGSVSGGDALRTTASLAEPLPRRGKLRFDSEGKGGRLRWVLLGLFGVSVVVFLGRHWPFLPGTPPQSGPASSVEAPVQRDAPAVPESGGALPAAPAVVPVPSGPHEPLFQSHPGAAAVPEGARPERSAVPTSSESKGPAPAPVAPVSSEPPVSTPGTTTEAGAPAAAVSARPSGAAVPVRLTATQDAWVEVRQGDGKAVFMGTVKPGQPLETSGAAPLTLTINNADAVTLEAGGHPIDLRPLTTTPGNLARVRVP